MKIGIIAEGYHCIGTCITSFDEDGICVTPELPWTNLDDFNLADDMAEHMSEKEFHRYVPRDPHVEAEIIGHEVKYLQSDGIFMIFDVDSNRHYYFA